MSDYKKSCRSDKFIETYKICITRHKPPTYTLYIELKMCVRTTTTFSPSMPSWVYRRKINAHRRLLLPKKPFNFCNPIKFQIPSSNNSTKNHKCFKRPKFLSWAFLGWHKNLESRFFETSDIRNFGFFETGKKSRASTMFLLISNF